MRRVQYDKEWSHENDDLGFIPYEIGWELRVELDGLSRGPSEGKGQGVDLLPEGS